MYISQLPEVISLLHVNSFMVVKTFLAGLLVEFLVRPVFILVTDLTLSVKLKYVQYRLSFSLSLTLFAFFPMNAQISATQLSTQLLFVMKISIH